MAKVKLSNLRKPVQSRRDFVYRWTFRDDAKLSAGQSGCSGPTREFDGDQNPSPGPTGLDRGDQVMGNQETRTAETLETSTGGCLWSWSEETSRGQSGGYTLDTDFGLRVYLGKCCHGGDHSGDWYVMFPWASTLFYFAGSLGLVDVRKLIFRMVNSHLASLMADLRDEI